MSRLRVLFVTSEIHPLIKTGGLADVSASLPVALRELDVDVRVLIPGYRQVLEGGSFRCAVKSVRLLAATTPARILQGRLADSDVPLYVLDQPELFDREGGPYGDVTGKDWADNALRFGSLSRLAADIASEHSPLRWRADLLHCNDWQTGLGAAYAKLDVDSNAATVMSVHNIAFPGNFSADVCTDLELPPASFSLHGLEFYGALSFLKAGLYYADQLTTVSPTYARELQTPDFGGGFDGLLRARSADLTGILNGVDARFWNPATDPHIAKTYDADSLESKAANKSALQRESGLAQSPSVPLFGMISRMTSQKGGDLVLGAIRRLMDSNAQFVVLGTGETILERAFQDLAGEFPHNVRVTVGYDESLAHKIEAGADVFLMPSRFEPCGLNQMYSMLYGTLPVVRSTGGLADSVRALGDVDQPTGFSFANADLESLEHAMKEALTVYADPTRWRQMQRAAMIEDFSWHKSARAYRDVYTQSMSPVSNR